LAGPARRTTEKSGGSFTGGCAHPGRSRTRGQKPQNRHPASNEQNIRFFCDSGLGGLARWLRGSGFEAFWEPSIDDFELLQQATKLSATVLTTDSLLMERRVVRDHVIPALWLPPTLTIPEALAFVFHEFGLKFAPRAA